MPAPRHRAARHKAPRPSLTSRLPGLPTVPAALRRPPVAIGAGLAVTAVLASTVAVALPDDDAVPAAARTGLTATAPQAAAPDVARDGGDRVSRSADAVRDALELAPLTTESDEGGVQGAPALVTKARYWVTEDADLRTGPGESYPAAGEVEAGKKVAVTATTKGAWTQVIADGKPRWARTSLLSAEEPTLSGAPCPSGSGVEDGLQPATVAVHRAVCKKFPEVSSYGGMRSDGMHGRGQALDIMTSGATGDEIAAFVREHAAELGVTEVIWQQRIWTTQRAGEGWRSMSDRGSPTANHMDHVHVTTGG